MFQATIDLCAVNAATQAKQWPMPIVGGKLTDFNDNMHFASLDYCAGYCHCPLPQCSYGAYGSIASQGTFASARVLHGKKAIPIISINNPGAFDTLRDAIDASIHKFMIHARTEHDLLPHVDSFIAIGDKHNSHLLTIIFILYQERKMLSLHH